MKRIRKPFSRTSPTPVRRVFAVLGMILAFPNAAFAQLADPTLEPSSINVKVCRLPDDYVMNAVSVVLGAIPASHSTDTVSLSWSMVGTQQGCTMPELEYQASLFVGTSSTAGMVSPWSSGQTHTFANIGQSVTLQSNESPVRFSVTARKRNRTTDLSPASNVVATTIVFSAPPAPTVDAPVSPTNKTSVTLTGARSAETSIEANGTQIAARSAAGTWTGTVTVPTGTDASPRTTTYTIIAKDSRNLASPATTVQIVHPIQRPSGIDLPTITTDRSESFDCVKQSGTGVRMTVGNDDEVIADVGSSTDCDADVNLALGQNTISFVAFNSAGEESAATTVTVTRTQKLSSATAPAAPTVSTPVTPTNKTALNFSGTKPAGSSVTQSGTEIASASTATSWSATVTVPSGSSIAATKTTLLFRAKSTSGESSVVTREVEVPIQKPAGIALPASTTASSVQVSCGKMANTGVRYRRVGGTNTDLSPLDTSTVCGGTVALNVGANDLQFLAFNSAGEESQPTAISITRTSPAVPVTGAVCGNRVIENGEQCDAPGSATCSTSCQRVLTSAPATTTPVIGGSTSVPSGPVCGNGVIEGVEECEPAGTTTCSSACRVIASAPATTPAACGNLRVETGEQCDPPAGMSCSNACQVVAPSDPTVQLDPNLPPDTGPAAAPAKLMHLNQDAAEKLSCHVTRPQEDFPDVTPAHPRYEKIQFMHETFADEHQLVSGMIDGKFHGTDLISRYEVLKLALRSNCIEFLPDSALGNFQFADVPRDGSEMSQVIYTAVLYGIVRGFDDGTFRPNVAVSREQALKMLLIPAQLVPADTIATRTYVDTTLDSAFATYISRSIELGHILPPYPADRFEPSLPVLREDLVTAQANILRQIEILAQGGQVVNDGESPRDEREDLDGDGLPDMWEMLHFGALEISDGTGDPDADGLDDSEEFATRTDPMNWDSDNDGLADGEEVNVYQTDPLKPDTDGDGAADGLEISVKTDPLDPLSFPVAGTIDGSWLSTHFPTEVPPPDWNTLAGRDSDGDGLSDLQEYLLGTNPTSTDSDGDGMADGEEQLELRTNPRTQTDPNVRSELRITNFYDARTIADTTPLIRGIGPVGVAVSLSMLPASGNPIALGDAQVNTEGKFVFQVETPLADGVYTILATAGFNGEILRATVPNVTIDSSLELAAPSPEKLDEYPIDPAIVDLQLIVANARPVLAGSTTVNSTVVATWESLVSTSSLIADAATGAFAIRPPNDLPPGAHTVTLYAITPEGMRSKDVVVHFEVSEMGALGANTAASGGMSNRAVATSVASVLSGLASVGGGWWYMRRRKNGFAM